jgi:hypothetical protein
MAKIRRNAPCPCGSGSKAKRCCYGINETTQIHCLPTELCQGVVANLIDIDEVELMVLEEELLDLPEIDTSLQVPLGILTPTIGAALCAIQDDDVDLFDEVLDEVMLEVDWPDRRTDLARAVITLRDQGRIPSDLAALAVIDLDCLQSTLFASSVAESLAVLAGEVSTPAGLIVATP